VRASNRARNISSTLAADGTEIFMRKVALSLLGIGLACSATALAQPPPAPAPAGSAAAASSGPIPIPPPPNVNDPMLAPVPPAKRIVTTWEEALGYVKTRSTDLRIAYAEVRRAEAQTRGALAAYLPQVNGAATATHQLITNANPPGLSTGLGASVTGGADRTPLPNLVTGNIQIVQPIINVGNWDQITTQRINEDVQKLSLDDVKRNLALSVANAIVGVVTAERIAELNRVGFRQALERLDLTQRKKALGAAGVTGLDVVRAQQDVETARASLVTGDESLRQAREAFGIALGFPEQVGVSRDVNMNGLEASALRVCQVADSVDARSDVAAARRKLDVAKRNVQNVYYSFLPTLNAQTTIATTTANTGFSPNTTWNIQAVLQVPIWDGGVRYSQLRQANAVSYEAEQQLEALRRTATVQITQARRGVDVAEASRKVAADTRALAAETDRLTQISYREGAATSLELVVAAAALRQADITLALREFDLVKARVLAVLALATCPW